MVRSHTPAELQEIDRILKDAQPLFEQMEAAKRADKTRWAGEIAMLERRVREEYVEVDLGDGDCIALRACLSETESAELGELYKRWFTPMQNLAPAAIAERKRIGYAIIALVTANPLITVDWLEQNPDRFSTDDAVNVILSWAEQRQTRENERAQKLVSAISFRAQPAGPELR